MGTVPLRVPGYPQVFVLCLLYPAAQQFVEMVYAFFHAGRITAAVVEPGGGAEVDALYYPLVFELHGVEVVACPLPQQLLIAYIGEKAHTGAVYALRLYHVHGDAPGVHVEHEVGEYPPVIGCHALAIVGGALGKFEGRFTAVGDAELEIAMVENMGFVLPEVEHFVEALVHERDVQSFEVVFAVQRPVGFHFVGFGEVFAQPQLSEWKPVQSVLQGLQYGGEISVGVYGTKQQIVPCLGSGGSQVVHGGGEVFGAFKHGHGAEAAVRVEAASVVAAADGAGGLRGIEEDEAAVGAHIAHELPALDAVLEDEGFIQTTLQQGERIMGVGTVIVGMSEPLPGGGEYGFQRGGVKGSVVVVAAGQGGRGGDGFMHGLSLTGQEKHRTAAGGRCCSRW